MTRIPRSVIPILVCAVGALSLASGEEPRRLHFTRLKKGKARFFEHSFVQRNARNGIEYFRKRLQWIQRETVAHETSDGRYSTIAVLRTAIAVDVSAHGVSQSVPAGAPVPIKVAAEIEEHTGPTPTQFTYDIDHQERSCVAVQISRFLGDQKPSAHDKQLVESLYRDDKNVSVGFFEDRPCPGEWDIPFKMNMVAQVSCTEHMKVTASELHGVRITTTVSPTGTVKPRAVVFEGVRSDPGGFTDAKFVSASGRGETTFDTTRGLLFSRTDERNVVISLTNGGETRTEERDDDFFLRFLREEDWAEGQ